MAEEAKQGDFGIQTDVSQGLDKDYASSQTAKKPKSIRPQPSLVHILRKDAAGEAKTLDVEKDRKRIVNVFKKLVALELKNPNLSAAEYTKLLSETFRRELSDRLMGQRRKPKAAEPLGFALNQSIEHGDIEIPDFLGKAIDCEVADTTIVAPHFATSTSSLKLDGVLALSYEGLSGSTSDEQATFNMGPEGQVKRDLNCENLVATNTGLYGKNIARNLKGGVLKHVVVGGVGALADAFGGLHCIDVTVVDENGVRNIKDYRFPIERPERVAKLTESYESTSNRFVAKKI